MICQTFSGVGSSLSLPRKSADSQTGPTISKVATFASGEGGETNSICCNTGIMINGCINDTKGQITAAVDFCVYPCTRITKQISSGNSRQTWDAPYRLGLMSSAMLPSTTMKFFVPLDFTPVTLLTKQQVLAIRDLPGSMMRVRSRERTNSRTYQFNTP